MIGRKGRSRCGRDLGSPAKRWATVTPIVLDRYPKAEGDAEETIKVACERIGLPRPIDVMVSPVSLFEGVPPARQFPPLPAKFGKPRGFHAHAVITFQSEVRGPLLLWPVATVAMDLVAPGGRWEVENHELTLCLIALTILRCRP